MRRVPGEAEPAFGDVSGLVHPRGLPLPQPGAYLIKLFSLSPTKGPKLARAFVPGESFQPDSKLASNARSLPCSPALRQAYLQILY